MEYPENEEGPGMERAQGAGGGLFHLQWEIADRESGQENSSF